VIKARHIDVGLLIVNCCQNYNVLAPLKDLKGGDVDQIVQVGLEHPLFVLKTLLPLLLNREKVEGKAPRSGIILMNSSLSMFPATGSMLYSTVNRFTSNIAEGLYYELKQQGH